MMKPRDRKSSSGASSTGRIKLVALRRKVAVAYSEVADKFCGSGEERIKRGIFHLPDRDPVKPPVYASVRSQQTITLVLLIIIFFVDYICIRVAVFTNDVCEGAAEIFLALMILAGIIGFGIVKVGFHMGYVTVCCQHDTLTCVLSSGEWVGGNFCRLCWFAVAAGCSRIPTS